MKPNLFKKEDYMIEDPTGVVTLLGTIPVVPTVHRGYTRTRFLEDNGQVSSPTLYLSGVVELSPTVYLR